MKKLIFLAAVVSILCACGGPSTANPGGNNGTAKANVANAGAADSTKPAVDKAALETELRDTDLAWSAAAGKGDVEATSAYMAEDGVTMSPNVPLAKGKDAIKKEWQGLLGLKDGRISWQPTSVEIAASGEIGYTSGTWKMSWTDDKKGKLEDHGKYLEVWKKIDGKWKCTYDMYSSDQAAPAAEKGKG